MRPSVLIASLVLAASGASAMDIATYDKQRREPANGPSQMRLRIYLLGLGEGLKLANGGLSERGEKPLYCQPASVNLFAEDYRQMIDAQLREARDTLVRQERSIEQILLQALQQRYACPAGAAEPAARPASAP